METRETGLRNFTLGRQTYLISHSKRSTEDLQRERPFVQTAHLCRIRANDLTRNDEHFNVLLIRAGPKV